MPRPWAQGTERRHAWPTLEWCREEERRGQRNFSDLGMGDVRQRSMDTRQHERSTARAVAVLVLLPERDAPLNCRTQSITRWHGKVSDVGCVTIDVHACGPAALGSLAHKQRWRPVRLAGPGLDAGGAMAMPDEPGIAVGQWLRGIRHVARGTRDH